MSSHHQICLSLNPQFLWMCLYLEVDFFVNYQVKEIYVYLWLIHVDLWQETNTIL